MANLMRLRSLQSLVSRVSQWPVSRGSLPVLSQCRRAVNTSGSQKSDSKTPSTDDSGPYIEEDPSKPKKCWVSWGFDDTSQYADRHFTNVLFFVTISLCLTSSGFVLAYLPDNRYKDWAQREAYLVLREREAAGLPPIDINIVNPAKVKLPTDEELEDTDVII